MHDDPSAAPGGPDHSRSIGPFARQAGPVIDACLAAGVPYVDIANEWPAVTEPNSITCATVVTTATRVHWRQAQGQG